LARRAMRATSLKSDEHRVGGAIRGRRGADRISRDALREKAAAEAAEIGTIEQIRLLILAERQHDGLPARQIENERVAAAEIGVTRVERAPIGGGEEIGVAPGMAQIAVEAEYGLAICPVTRAKRVAGRDIERNAIAGD